MQRHPPTLVACTTTGSTYHHKVVQLVEDAVQGVGDRLQGVKDAPDCAHAHTYTQQCFD